jgi:hypothetical protein
MRSSRARSASSLRRVLVLLALAAPLLLPVAGSAGARPGSKRVQVFDAGAVEGLEFAPRLRARRGAARASRREARLSFRAQGRRFELELRENEKLLSAMSVASREGLRARHEAYAGELAGQPGTWVRLTRSGNRWTGLIFDGEELLAVEPAAGLATSSRAPAASSLAFYRARDVEIPGSCALEASSSPLPSLEGLVDELEGPPDALSAASAEIQLAILGDPAFVQGHADPEGAAVALLNAVDGLYSEQVGVSVRMVELQLLQTDQGLTSTNPSLLLDQLTDLTGSGAIANPGLVHLLTGKNLDGSTVGIAYLDVLCNQRWGAGLSEIRRGSMAANTVLLAHELGHNFGAPHDNQSGSACAATPSGYVMSPSLNNGSDEFSQCSLAQMEPEIASARCLVALPDEPTEPDCSNGIDDDGDGAIDNADDGCSSLDDPSEERECRDGLDNDDDGLVDYPEDPECVTEDQFLEITDACGIGFEIIPILLPLMQLRRRRERSVRS